MRNRDKMAGAVTAVAAGILTEIIYSILVAEQIEGQVANGSIKLYKISEFAVWQKVCGVVFVFFALWVVITFVVPIIIYVIKSLKPHRKIKVDVKMALEAYMEFKSIVKRSHNTMLFINAKDVATNMFIFSNMCSCILEMHRVFYTEKRENEIVIKNIFRTGATVNDIDRGISLYEYIMLVDLAGDILWKSYIRLKKDDDNLLNSDFNKISEYLKKLKELPQQLGV